MYPHISDRRRRRTAIRPLLLVSALACCFAGSAYAQETVESEEKTLEPVVVTASRVEQLQKDAIPSTTVISSETIQNKKLADLPSLLKSEAGIDFARTGGRGQTTSVFMRGVNSRQLLVIVDGVPIQDGNELGTPLILEQLQPDQIDHIEVVRGNVSAIYGSGAMGGVIQIFTKQGTGKPTANVFAEYGSHDTTKIGAGISGKTEGGTSFALSATRFRTDGISAVNTKRYPNENSDDDYDRNLSISASLSQKLNEDHELGVKLYMYDAKFEYDGGGSGIPSQDDWGKSKQWIGSVYSKNRITEDWLSTVTLSQAEHRREYNTENGAWGDSHNVMKTETSMLQWNNNVSLSADWMMTAGLDAAAEKVKNDGESHQRDRYSAFAGLLGKMGDHNVQANVRYDHVDDAGSDTTGYLGYGYDLTPEWKLLASVSTSFLAPNLYQQYDPYSGNEHLESERSTNYEAGIQYAKDKDLVRLSVFEWHTRNLIDYVQTGYYTGEYSNVGRAKNTGAELTAQTEVFGLDVGSTMTWQNPKDRETGDQLDRRAKFFGTLNVSKTCGQWYLGGDLQYTGHRPDGDHDLGSYTLVNLNARYNVTKEVSLYARIENLFDKEYETAYGYNQMDRAAYVGVNVKM